MTNSSNYYEIIGIPKNASFSSIKQAYRKLALKHHPDRVEDKDKKGAEERFKRINEAYEVLSDPQKRNYYDRYGKRGLNNGFPSNNGVVFTEFSHQKSKRAIIEEKLAEKRDFSLREFARHLDVSIDNLKKIIEVMINKNMTSAVISGELVIF